MSNDVTPAPRWAISLLLLAGLGVYANCLTKDFVFDDVHAITANTALADPVASFVMLTRPLIGLSLSLNYQLGKLNPFGYHLLNVTVHLLASLPLFGLVRRTLQLPRWPEHYRQSADSLAFAVALLWLVHPLQTQSVTYVIQRCESMMGLFFLLAVYCSVRALDARPLRWSILAVVSCFLSACCKEVAPMAVFVVLAYDWVFAPGAFSATFRRRWPLYLGLAAAGFSLYVLSVLLSSGDNSTAGFDYKGISKLHYLLTQAGVLVHYLRLMVWPSPLVLDYIDWPTVRSVADWQSWLPPGLVVLALLGVTGWGLWRKRWYGFVGAWFFLILAPTSSIVPIADVVFEHRLYLPLASAVVLVVLAADRLLTVALSEPARAPVGRAALLAVAFLLGLLTIARNEDYRTAATMYADNARKRPNNWRARQNLVATMEADPAARAKELAEAERLRPGDLLTRLQRGQLAFREGRPDEAIADLSYAIPRRYPDTAPAHVTLGNSYLMKGDLPRAETEFRKAVELDPRTALYAAQLALVLHEQGKTDEAETLVANALRLNPDLPRTTTQVARRTALVPSSGDAGRDRAARFQAYHTARLACLLTHNGDPECLDSLAIAYAADGQFPKAVETARLALDLARKGRPDLTAEIERRLRLFEQKKPYTLANVRQLDKAVGPDGAKKP